MNFLLCLATCVVVVASVGATSLLSLISESNPFVAFQPRTYAPSSLSVETRYIRQRVDNFDTTNHNYYNQRYLANSEFHTPGGPLFVLLGGFLAVSAQRLEDSLALDMARQLNGSVFYLEHRYYGNSIPVANLTTENLRYLTVDQALADIAYFVSDIQRRFATEEYQRPAVIVIGGHYSGNLAVWFRQKYPHLSAGAWASGAPLLSVVNHHLYKETAAESYRTFGGDGCYDALENSFAQMEAMVVNGQLDELSGHFFLCRDSYLRTERSISLFFTVLSETFAGIVETTSVDAIRGVCQELQNPAAASPVHALASVFEMLFNGTGLGTDYCLPLDYDFLVELDREVELDSIVALYGIRQSTYQYCMQLGWQHTSDSPNQPFGNRFSLDFANQGCESVFKEIFNATSSQAASDRLNVVYGGLTPHVDQVLYTHGELDPWRTIGKLAIDNHETIIFVIPESPQGAELGAFSESDSVYLALYKQVIVSYIEYWIILYNHNQSHQ